MGFIQVFNFLLMVKQLVIQERSSHKKAILHFIHQAI